MAAALAAFLILTSTASAASDPLAGGTTTITLGKGFTTKLSKNGIKTLGSAPATVTGKGSSIALPVLSGSIDPVAGQGSAVLAGGFKFKRGRKSASVGELSLETANKSLLAKVAGKKMKLASLDGLGVSRDGFGINLSIGSLKLTNGAAKALNKKLSFVVKKARKGKGRGKASASKGTAPPFKANMSIGSAISDTEPATVNVQPTGIAQLLARTQDRPPFETTEVKPGMVAPGAFGPTVEEIPALTFPISGGSFAPSGASGLVRTSGGVTFVQEPEGGIQIGVRFLGWTIDFATRTTSAEVFVAHGEQEVETSSTRISSGVVADLNMSGAVVRPDPATRTITVSGVVTEVRPEIAALMNSTYERDAFKAGDSLGTYSFVLQTE